MARLLLHLLLPQLHGLETPHVIVTTLWTRARSCHVTCRLGTIMQPRLRSGAKWRIRGETNAAPMRDTMLHIQRGKRSETTRVYLRQGRAAQWGIFILPRSVGFAGRCQCEIKGLQLLAILACCSGSPRGTRQKLRADSCIDQFEPSTASMGMICTADSIAMCQTEYLLWTAISGRPQPATAEITQYTGALSRRVRWVWALEAPPHLNSPNILASMTCPWTAVLLTSS